MNNNKFGWCFIGSGGIAKKVMGDMQYTNGSYPAAVYSRTYENACNFAEKYGAKPYETIKQALSDPDIKAVYIATPNTFHKEQALMAMKRGLPVLCEKPIAVNYRDASEMIGFAQENKIYFLDGLWTRFNPVICRALEMVKEGKIGQIRSLSASFCIYKDFNPDARHFDPALGGGSLLDIGIYPILFACMLFNENPVEISVMADYAPNGVEFLLSMNLRYPCGAIARLFSGFSSNEPQDACISGTGGYIHIPYLWKAKTATVHLLETANEDETIDPVFPGFGYQYMFDAAMDDIIAGRTENALVTHELSLRVMKIIDQVQERLT